MFRGRGLQSIESLHTLPTYFGLSNHKEKSGLSLHTASAGQPHDKMEGASAEAALRLRSGFML